MSKPNWRIAESYAYIFELAPQEIAWEFLRRNPDYQSCVNTINLSSDEDTSHLAKRWGLRFLADPALNAIETSIFWHPEICAYTVILDAGVCVTSKNITLTEDILSQAKIRKAKDGQHILLRKAGHIHQIFLTPRAEITRQLHAVIPFDNSTKIRMIATAQLWRIVMNRKAMQFSIHAQRRQKLIQSLRALDANLAGASHRLIAQEIFSPIRQEAESWRVSSMRGCVRRLVETGATLMKKGYRDLLTLAPAKGGRN